MGAGQDRDRSLFRSCVVLVATAWLGNALYAGGSPGGALKYWSPALVAFAMIAFLILHGRRAEGGRAIAVFCVAVFVIGWFAETIGSSTGFPFGHYQYAEIMGPFVGQVPVSVMSAYCVMGYVSWSMARLVAGCPDGPISGPQVAVLPVVAACLMVLWDLSMDPLRATVEGRWLWQSEGGYFGVPASNFIGWFVVTWTMFFVFALYRRRQAPAPAGRETAGAWRVTAPLMYLAFPVEYLLNPLLADPGASAIPLGNSAMPVSEIHASVALVTAATMVPAAMWVLLRARAYFPAPRSRQTRSAAYPGPKS